MTEHNNSTEKPNETDTPQQASAEEIRLSKAEHDALLQKLKEAEALQEKLLRSAADFDNAKKRLLKEKEDYFKYALEGMLLDLLPIMDNFERALSHRSDDPAQKALWSGIELIHKQLVETLNGRGLVRLDVLKKPFDPTVHEAVGQVYSPSEKEDTVAEEVVRGYLLNSKLLRAAKVKVFTRKTVEEEKAEEIT